MKSFIKHMSVSGLVSFFIFSFLYGLNLNSIKKTEKRNVTQVIRPDVSEDLETNSVEQEVLESQDIEMENFSELLSELKASVDSNGLGFSAIKGPSNQNTAEKNVDIRPKLVTKKQVPFPPRALSKGLEGYVYLKVLIDNRGHVIETAVLDSNPKGLFEKSAQLGVADWIFHPAIKSGQPVSAWTHQKIVFKQG